MSVSFKRQRIYMYRKPGKGYRHHFRPTTGPPPLLPQMGVTKSGPSHFVLYFRLRGAFFRFFGQSSCSTIENRDKPQIDPRPISDAETFFSTRPDLRSAKHRENEKKTHDVSSSTSLHRLIDIAFFVCRRYCQLYRLDVCLRN